MNPKKERPWKGRMEEVLVDTLAESPHHDRGEEQRHGEVEGLVDEAIAAGDLQLLACYCALGRRSHSRHLDPELEEKRPNKCKIDGAGGSGPTLARTGLKPQRRIA